jgi:hypothetical protein
MEKEDLGHLRKSYEKNALDSKGSQQRSYGIL